MYCLNGLLHVSMYSGQCGSTKLSRRHAPKHSVFDVNLFLSSLLVRLKFLPAVVNHNLLYGDPATLHSPADTQHLNCELYILSTVIVSYPYYVCAHLT